MSQKCKLNADYLGKTPRKAAAIPGNIRIIARFDGLEFIYIGFSSDSVLSFKDFIISGYHLVAGIDVHFFNFGNFPKPMTKTAKEFQVIENCFRTCITLHEKFPPYLKLLFYSWPMSHGITYKYYDS